MITEEHGNLLSADADALVNTVNTVGVMGKGIALQFKRAYPDMFKAYAAAVKSGDVRLGTMHVWATGQMAGPRYVINFPTKRHWRGPSRLNDIEAGLADLIRVVAELGISSIAVPPLGCGNGGLAWTDVEPAIRRAFAQLPNLDVHVYPPGQTPLAAEMTTHGNRPNMTPSRAALIALMDGYALHAMEGPSLIAAQKLTYFLQTCGEPLRLNFVRHVYGPYANNLRHVLQLLEGHYLSGFGDGNRPVHEAEPLTLLPGAVDAASPIIDRHPETRHRIDRVMDLIDGFESSYGLELLATVHWASHDDPDGESDPARAEARVRSWNSRKNRMFTSEHIQTAWSALHDRGWLSPQPARV